MEHWPDPRKSCIYDLPGAVTKKRRKEPGYFYSNCFSCPPNILCVEPNRDSEIGRLLEAVYRSCLLEDRTGWERVMWKLEGQTERGRMEWQNGVSLSLRLHPVQTARASEDAEPSIWSLWQPGEHWRQTWAKKSRNSYPVQELSFSPVPTPRLSPPLAYCQVLILDEIWDY